jgi:hypothetical protein
MRRPTFRESLCKAIRSTGAVAEDVARTVADAIEGEGPARTSIFESAREAMRAALDAGRDAGRAAGDIVGRSAAWAGKIGLDQARAAAAATRGVLDAAERAGAAVADRVRRALGADVAMKRRGRKA